MSDPETFRTKEDEVSRLLDELISLRELLRDISRKLSNLELRAKRAFPSVAQKRQTLKANISAPASPSLSSQSALELYDTLVDRARAGAHNDATNMLTSLSLADLVLLSKELGLPLGRSKPVKKLLVSGILGRIKQSVMLSQHSARPVDNGGA